MRGERPLIFGYAAWCVGAIHGKEGRIQVLAGLARFCQTVEYNVRVIHEQANDRSKYNLTLGILKGEVSLYHLPPVCLVWNQLYDNCQFLFLFAKQTNTNQLNRRSMVQ